MASRRRVVTNRGLDPMYPERRLCTAVGLAASALMIFTGTVIVLILANVTPVERRWPTDAGTWEDKGNVYVSPDGRFGDGYSHAHCEFDKSDYVVVIKDPLKPPRPPLGDDIWPWMYTTPPTSDDELGPGDDWGREPELPADDPFIHDDFPDVEDDEPDYGDNGLVVISVDTAAKPTDPNLSGWSEKPGSEGVVRDVPTAAKPVPREPFARLSKMKAQFTVWNETSDSFRTFDSLVAFEELDSAGFFGPQALPRPLVIVTHGWHGMADESQFLKAGVRLYSRVVNEAAVMYLDWDEQGAKGTAANATLFAWRVNVTRFVNSLDTETDLHCVGHSVGAFACASVCRQFYAHAKRPCTRLVAINPYEILDAAPEMTDRLHARTYRTDADYVAVLASSTRGMDPANENEADEYIIYNNLAASSEICDSLDDWGVDVCAVDDNGGRYCELFGVHNVTFTVQPTDKKRFCSSMLPAVYFFAAADSLNGVTLIRSNPMASSPLVGMLPSVWDARVYSKDYRYSTFVRNDSVWYSANYGHLNTGISNTRVFTVVVPYLSSAVIYGSAYTAKTRYHNISVYAAFVRGPENEPDPVNVTVLTPGPILSAYLWEGRGTADLKTSFKDSITFPVTGQHFVKYDCSQNGANYTCAKTQIKSNVPALRRRIPVGEMYLPIPADGCLPYSPPDVNLVVWKRKVMRMPIGVNVTVTYSHSRQLMAVVLENHEMPKNTTLLTYYDSCEAAGQAGLYFDYDWGKAQMTAAFIAPGRYTMRWYFLFEVLEIPIVAFERTAAPYPVGTSLPVVI